MWVCVCMCVCKCVYMCMHYYRLAIKYHHLTKYHQETIKLTSGYIGINTSDAPTTLVTKFNWSPYLHLQNAKLNLSNFTVTSPFN